MHRRQGGCLGGNRTYTFKRDCSLGVSHLNSEADRCLDCGSEDQGLAAAVKVVAKTAMTEIAARNGQGRGCHCEIFSWGQGSQCIFRHRQRSRLAAAEAIAATTNVVDGEVASIANGKDCVWNYCDGQGGCLRTIEDNLGPRFNTIQTRLTQ